MLVQLTDDQLATIVGLLEAACAGRESVIRVRRDFGLHFPNEQLWLEKYRAALAAMQQPAMPQADWSQAPEWAEWWTVDSEDEAWWYEYEPRALIYCWDSAIGRRCRDTNYPAPSVWRQTLQRRPP